MGQTIELPGPRDLDQLNSGYFVDIIPMDMQTTCTCIQGASDEHIVIHGLAIIKDVYFNKSRTKTLYT